MCVHIYISEKKLSNFLFYTYKHLANMPHKNFSLFRTNFLNNRVLNDPLEYFLNTIKN